METCALTPALRSRRHARPHPLVGSPYFRSKVNAGAEAGAAAVDVVLAGGRTEPRAVAGPVDRRATDAIRCTAKNESSGMICGTSASRPMQASAASSTRRERAPNHAPHGRRRHGIPQLSPGPQRLRSKGSCIRACRAERTSVQCALGEDAVCTAVHLRARELRARRALHAACASSGAPGAVCPA